jgi:CMP-N,N'-diacetyllegionaminic acid synthase
MNLIAIIPARSGSKGVPGKNIKLLGGIPLFAYSIIAAKMMPSVSRVIVSTDSNEYAEIAKSFGAEVPFLRPIDISDDKSTDYDLFLHALNWFKENENDLPEYLLHLRPTTPLRDPKIMEDAVYLFFNNKDKATSLRSGHNAPESPYKWFLKDDNNYFKGLRDDLTPEKVNLPRQSFPTVYIPDGYIDILKSTVILHSGTLHGDKMLVFESPFCVEVDTNDDFQYLEFQIEKNRSVILDSQHLKNRI